LILRTSKRNPTTPMAYDEEAVARYYALRPTRFSLLKTLSVSQDWPAYDDVAAVEVTLELVPTYSGFPKHGRAGGRLRMTFSGVMDFCMKPPGFPIHIDFLEIGPVRDRRCEDWQVLNYKVEDEELALAFYCRSFEAVLECD
jgi:hypothetical protein